MTTLHLTRGLPASGKSTFAKAWVAEHPEGRVRVNRDDLRSNLFGRPYGLTFAQENTVTAVQHAAVTAALGAGKDVIVDDTHLRVRYVREWRALAAEAGADVAIHEFVEPLDVLIARDASRAVSVGESVIRDLWARFTRNGVPQKLPEDAPVAKRFETYVPDETKPATFVFDLDGTLAHFTNTRGPYDTDVSNDVLDRTVAAVMLTLHTAGFTVVLVSGRKEAARLSTEAWLHARGLPYAALFMRQNDDGRPDDLVKYDILREHLRGYNVQGVFDDRDRVVDMWRSVGIKCFQVAPGAF